MTRIMAIDPGLARCGLVVCDTDGLAHRFVRAAVFESDGDITDTYRLISDKRVARARGLRDWIKTHLTAHTPDVVALEEFGFLRGQHATACLAMAYMTLVCEIDRTRVPIVATLASRWREELSGLRGTLKRESRAGLSKAQRKALDAKERIAKDHRTKEREQRAHIEAMRRVEGSAAILCRFNKQAQVHALDALGLFCWAVYTPTVKQLCNQFTAYTTHP